MLLEIFDRRRAEQVGAELATSVRTEEHLVSSDLAELTPGAADLRFDTRSTPILSQGRTVRHCVVPDPVPFGTDTGGQFSPAGGKEPLPDHEECRSQVSLAERR